MTMSKSNLTKLSLLAGSIGLTLAIHYGLILEPIFGHTGWVHAIHGRFCYIPIVVAGTWFGMRGGIGTAAVISIGVIPYLATGQYHGELVGELVEILFYFAIALLTGALVDREFSLRRKQAETERQLQRSHQLSVIGQMAAGVAHEIKNPLASIKGAVEILSDTGTSESDRQEFSRIVDSEIKRIDGTVGEFLAFARPKEPSLKPVDFVDLVKQAVRQFEPQAQSKNVVVESSPAGSLPVLADPEKIHQVLLNLLLNALEASEENGRIVIGAEASGHNKATVTITDFGSGISKEELENIFDPFYTTKSTGTGLGLAVVNSIITGHEGTITATSDRKHGTRFTIILPLRRTG